MPELADDPRFANPVTRHGNQDDLDAIVSAWTSARTKYEVMTVLQNAGVPGRPGAGRAGSARRPPTTAPGDISSRWIIRRKLDWAAGSTFPAAGACPATTCASANRRRCWARTTSTSLSEMLGLAGARIADLEAAEAIGQALAGARIPASVPLDRQVELGWTVDYDTDYPSRPPE